MASESSTTPHGQESSRSAFEEERQVLLDSMAVQLSGVVERMTKANDNIAALNKQNAPVSDLATMWRDSYASSRQLVGAGADTNNSNNRNGSARTGLLAREDSSLSVYATESAM